MENSQDRNFTTQGVKAISKGDIFCFFFFTQHLLCVRVCVCVFICTGAGVLYDAKVCTSPPHHVLLWPVGPVLLPSGHHYTFHCQKPPNKSRTHYQGGNGTSKWLVHCCTSTISTHETRRETELPFTCLKAVTAAAIECCRRKKDFSVPFPPHLAWADLPSCV